MSDVISEITPLTEKDCYHLVERHKKQHTYPLHRHPDLEINFVENCCGNRRIVGDNIEVLGNYDLCLRVAVWSIHGSSMSVHRMISVR